MAKSNTDELNFIFKCFDGFLEGFVQQGKWFLQDGKKDISDLPALLKSILDQCPDILKNEKKGESPFGKWEKAINKNTDEDTKLCFKYIEWFWNFPDSETTSNTKNTCIDDIIPEYHFPNKKWGIGGAKPRSQKPQEIKYLVELLLCLSKISFNSIDDIKKTIVEHICNDEIKDKAIVDEVPFKNALLYLCKPEEYEPIFSNGHKESIIKAFPELYSDKDIDKALMQIRKSLKISDNDGFYREDIRAVWNSNSKDTNDKLKKKNNLLNIIKMKQYKSLLEKSHNLILSGAPGTGKTYLAKHIAAQIIMNKPYSEDLEHDELFKSHVGFVQFHPSYDYSDFVEGLRPIQDENGNVGFVRRDGVFKSFCSKAINQNTDNFDDCWDKLLVHVRNENSKGNLVKIGNWEYGLSSKESLKYQSTNTPSNYTFTITKNNVYAAYRGLKARESGAFQNDMVDVVKYLKENFGLIDYTPNKQSTENIPYVFIIDEINRGEMSKIFGELFFSIDPGYRGPAGRVNTQYQNMVESGDVFCEGFYVPKNVYIIGTMNDIDRSVESMDFAMRRRFAFKEVRATDRESMLDEKITDAAIRSEAIIKMRNVNYRIQTIEGLNEAYHVGPAYFGKIEGNDFDELWNNHIKGLLNEYLRGMPNAKELLDSLERAYQETELYVKLNNNGDLELDAKKSEDWKNKIINKQ